ncbi:MAG: response regulator transcription factor [Longimicrobiales bacterium]
MSTRSALETSRDPSAMASPYAGRILVIEDEPDMAFGLAHNLGFEGYEVAIADTAQAGLEVYRSFHPALILLDLRLPDMHGLEVLRAIRSGSTDVRIMIVSCLDAPEERADGFYNGANDYLIKPFGIPELLARVRAQLQHLTSSAASELRRRDYHESATFDGQYLVLDAACCELHRSPGHH